MSAKDHELEQTHVQLTELQGRLQQNETRTEILQQRLSDREQEITDLRERVDELRESHQIKPKDTEVFAIQIKLTCVPG